MVKSVALFLSLLFFSANLSSKDTASSSEPQFYRPVNLEHRVIELEAQVDYLLELLDGVARMTDPYTLQDTLRFSDMNVQIVNGLGWTSRVNGRGNLIIGYNGAIWVDPSGQREGSHMLIIGDDIMYTAESYGGIVVGYANRVSAPYASVIGGIYNSASDVSATVIGGSNNSASGPYSTVTGGRINHASGTHAAILGGVYNQALGDHSSVTGGDYNTASGYGATVSGGSRNFADGHEASVTGGDRNTATGWFSAVTGGSDNVAIGSGSSITGGRGNETQNRYTVIIGGQDQIANSDFCVAGVDGGDC